MIIGKIKLILMNKNLFLFYLIAFVYLLDEKINQFFEINGIGFLLVFLIWFYFQIKNNIKFLLSNKIIIIIILIFFYQSILITLSPCSPNIKSIISLILIIPYFLLVKSGFILNIIHCKNLRNLIILITLVLLMVYSIGGDSYRFIRVQYENSWTALYLSPFIIYNFLINKFDKLSIFAVLIIILTSFSSTFLIIILLVLFFILIKSKRYLLFIPFILPLPLFLYYYVQPFFERIETVINYSHSDFMNLSSLVWLNGFSMAGNYFALTKGLGVGFNSMGCSSDFRFYGNYMDQIFALSDSTLNILDGSFIASKFISELGIIGILIVIFLTLKSMIILFIGMSTRYSFINEDRIKVAGAILTIVFLYIRGGGYFQLGFFIALSMLFSLSNKGTDRCL